VSSEPPADDRNTRERILDETWGLFERRGARFTVSDVAKASRVSRQAVYLHFGSRSGLFVAAVRHQDEKSGIAHAFERAATQPSGSAALEGWIRVWLGYIPTILPAAREIVASSATDADARDALRDRMDLQRGFLTLILERVRDEAALAPGWDPPRAADFVWSLVHLDAWQHLVVEAGWSPNRFIESRLAVVRSLLLTVPEDAIGDR
jgi:AcrR family transcriptional regulator